MKLPQETAPKRYTQVDLERFVIAADAKFASDFRTLPPGEQQRLAKDPSTSKALRAIWGNQTEEQLAEIFPTRRLARYGKEYNENTHTPELLANVWGNLWEVWGKMANVKIEVPKPEVSTNEIRDIENKGRMLIYLPPQLSQAEHLADLVLLLEDKGRNAMWIPNSADSTSWITNHYDQSGWLSVESAPRISDEVPYTKDRTSTKEALAKEAGFASGELVGQTVNTFIVGSLFSKLITGQYFDKESGTENYPGLLFGSAMHHLDSYKVNIPYGSTRSVWTNEGTARTIYISDWGGALDYSLARTVELAPTEIITPAHLFPNYRRSLPRPKRK